MSDESSQSNRKGDQRSGKQAPDKGWVARIFALFFVAAILSVAMEMIGMLFFWPEQGSGHALNMLNTEKDYLNEDFKEGFFGNSPAKAIQLYARKAYYYAFELTGLEGGVLWLGEQTGVLVYAKAATYSVQVFFQRVGILGMSLPVFVLFGLVGAATGLTLRDIRRWSGGREYGGVYHMAKKVLPTALVSAWVLYLSYPNEIHPNKIILPCAVLFGVNLLILTSTYKKYL